MKVNQNYTPIKLVGEINKKFFLPPIQRGFVWPVEKIEALFDSLYRDYPIGIPIVWNIGNWSRKVCPLCSFYHDAGGDEDGLNEAQGVVVGKKYSVVLDGQQRLTALYLGITGWIKTKKKGRGLQNIEGNFENLFLCFNLAGDDSENFEKSIDDNEDSIPLFKFKTEEECRNWKKNNLWIEIREVCENVNDLSVFVKKLRKQVPQNIQKSCDKIDFKNKLKKLVDAIYNRPLNFFEVSFEKMNEISEIFARVNTQGMSLAKAELLYSRIVAEWSDGKSFIDKKTRMLKQNLSLSRSQDFVMRSMLYINDLPVRYNLEAFKSKRIQFIRQEENKEKLEKTLTMLMNERNRYAYTRGLSENALLPIAYYMMQKNFSVGKGEWKEIKKYYVISQAFGLFSGSSDTTLGEMRKVIQNCVQSKKKFSIEYLKTQSESEEIKKYFRFDEDDLQNLLEQPIYRRNKKLAHLLLGVIADDSSGEKDLNDFQLDHIHPESTITDEDFSDTKDSLMNLELLSPKLNQSKNADPLDVFLNDRTRFPKGNAGQKRKESFLNNNLISHKEKLWNLANFGDFCEDRKKRLFKELKIWFDLK